MYTLNTFVVNRYLGVPDVFDARPEELEFFYDNSQGEQARVLGRLNNILNLPHTMLMARSIYAILVYSLPRARQFWH